MPVNTINTVNMPFECFARYKFFTFPLFLNIEYHTSFISQATCNLILRRPQTKIKHHINASFYLIIVNVIIVQLFEHVNKRECAFFISNQYIPAVLETLDATHSCVQFIVVEILIFQFAYRDEIYVATVSLLVVAQYHIVAVFEEMHMYQFLLGLLRCVLEFAHQLCAYLYAVLSQATLSIHVSICVSVCACVCGSVSVDISVDISVQMGLLMELMIVWLLPNGTIQSCVFAVLDI